MTKKLDIEFPRDFYLDDVGVWRLKKEKITELEASNVQTNEEWLKSMTTEELAEWIYRAMFYKSCQKDVEDCACMQMMTKKDYIENWLKEKHDEVS